MAALPWVLTVHMTVRRSGSWVTSGRCCPQDAGAGRGRGGGFGGGTGDLSLAPPAVAAGVQQAIADSQGRLQREWFDERVIQVRRQTLKP